MRLILVRHGQTPTNITGVIDTGRPGPGLTELGHEQARALVDVLADEPIDRIAVSSLVRTSLTAAPLAEARGLVPEEHDGLREIAGGDLEGRADHDAIMAYLSVLQAWGAGDLSARIPGAESGAEVVARVDEVVAKVEGDGTAALFSHGGTLWAWAGIRGRNVDADFIAHRHLVNTGVIVLEGGSAEGWDVVSWLGESLDPSIAEGAAQDRSPVAGIDEAHRG